MVISKLLCNTQEIFSGFYISNAPTPGELIAKEIPGSGLDIEKGQWFVGF